MKKSIETFSCTSLLPKNMSILTADFSSEHYQTQLINKNYRIKEHSKDLCAKCNKYFTSFKQ